MSQQAIIAKAPVVNDDFSTLVQVEVPVPVPTGHDVLIKVKAVATNPVDTKVLNGSVGFVASEEKPIQVGWDGAGIVDAVGESVTLFKVGDEVYFSGSLTRPGSFADSVLVDERIVALKPTKYSFADAAALPLTTITAWEALIKLLVIPIPKTEEEKAANASKSILIVAGAGGVGSIAIQIAKRLLNLQVIATASRDDTIKWVKEKGADHTINHHQPLFPQIQGLGLPGVNYILSCTDITAKNFPEFVESSLPFGRIAFITSNNENVNIGSIMWKSLSISGELMFTRPTTGIDIAYQHELLTQAAKLFDDGVFSRTKNYEFEYNLENFQKALKLQASGSAIGKIVLVKN